MSTEVATELEQSVVDAINAERSAAGLDELKIEAHLNSSAQSHSDWMADTEQFSHEGAGGSAPTDRIESADFPLSGSWKTSENIAARSVSGELDAGEVDEMHEALMNSPGHRANILDPDVSYIGVGMAVGPRNVGGVDQDVVYLTQNFAKTDGEVLVQEQDADGATVLQSYSGGTPGDAPTQVEVPADEYVPEDEADPENEEAGTGTNSCFVATAAYGDRTHPDVVALRTIRDTVLVKHWAGRAFIRTYWVIGPQLARLVSHERKSGQVARAAIGPIARLAERRIERRM